MNDETNRFTLTCTDAAAPAPALAGVEAQGRLDGVLFELTLRQTYRNDSDRNLEVVYTFPLPSMAVLLGFASELNGERQEGVIVAKAQAEQRYESSLSDGDSPVMLEALAGGLHTANIGNLKPGDELVLECRFAQLLAFEQGRLRVAIPTTIAPRYGNAEGAGLQPQQVPEVSLAADYPLALSLTIGKALAGATITCPTHAFSTVRMADGTTRLDMASGARLDRDVVVVLEPREGLPSLLVCATDDQSAQAPVVMLAAFQTPPGGQRHRMELKLLVDCSGSMNGDSMASAQTALRGIVDDLRPGDHVSLSRFGSSVEHVFEPSPAAPQSIRHLRALIGTLQADLGGTEMEAALQAVFELPRTAESVAADVLLITDGEIWQAEGTVDAARRSGHRVFAIGVGSSPAENVLRALAEATGGACEFATPGEALEAAARRMLARLRQSTLTNALVDWGRTPVWSCGPTKSVFGGDTVLALAGFEAAPVARDVRLLAEDEQGRIVELGRGEADDTSLGDSLARIAASRRLFELPEADAAELALHYQLMSSRTNCILVHARSQDEKALAPAALHRVPSMMAAGWGGLGTLRSSAVRFDLSGPTPSLACMDVHLSVADISDLDAPAFLRKASPSETPLTLEQLARFVTDFLSAHNGNELGLAAATEEQTLHASVQQAIEELLAIGLDANHAWILLTRWINERADGLADAGIAEQLRPHLGALDTALAAQADKLLSQRLGRESIDSWTMTRTQRLRRAINQL